MLKNNLLSKFVLLCAVLLAGAGTAWAESKTYSLTPDQASTGSTATSYITTMTSFTYEGISWKMNQWNPKTLQIKTNQSSAASEFGFYNTSAFEGRITKVVITFSALTVSDASKLMFLGGTSEVTATTGGTAGTWDSSAKTLTWTPGASDNFTFFAFYQNGKAASGTNYLASTNAIVVTYEGAGAGEMVAAPTFSPAAGAVAYGTTVTLTQDDADLIMYTTNGTDPDYENSVGTLYENPIAITADMTIKAIAIDADENVSAVASAEYTVQRPAAPTFSPVAGKVAAGTTVTISGTGAMIIYTTDGTTPTYEPVNGDEYENPIEITSSMTIKAIVVDEHEFVSSVAEAAYVVSDPNILFYETFDNINGTGGRDGSYSGSVGINGTTGTDETWTAITGGGASKCIKLGTGSAIQTAQTSAIALEGDGTLTFSAAGWSSGTNTLVVQADNATLSGDVDITLSNGTWTDYTVNITAAKGDVVLYFKMKRGFLDDVKVEKAVAKNVATPTFSVSDGDFFEPQNVTLTCETEGAEIYYTIDGTAPSKSSTKYTGAIPVSTTTTIKAIAYKGEDDSDVATVTLTFPTVYNGIGELITAGESGYLKLTNAQVYYVGTNDIYIGDATGALDFYKTDLSYTAGQRLNGIAKVTYTLYNNSIPEVTAVAENSWVASEGTPEAITKTVQTITAADVNHLVEVVGTVGETSGDYYLADDDNNTVQFYDKFKVTTISDLVGKKVAAKGIVVIYKGETEVAPISLDVVLGTKSVTIGTAGYATFSHSAAVSFLGSGVTAYTVKVTDGVAKLTQVDKAPAGAAVVLEAEPGTYELSEIEEVGALENNDLKVSDGTVTGGESIFVLADGNNGVGFYRVAETVTIPAGKAYLQFANAARSFIGFDNETTGIKTMSDAQSTMNHEVYDLQGRRVAQPTKGLYIVNGKKMVIK